MSKNQPDRVSQLLANIDAALAKHPVVTDKQLEDIGRLRGEIQELCKAGKMEDAERCEKLALTIIRNGAPVPE